MAELPQPGGGTDGAESPHSPGSDSHLGALRSALPNRRRLSILDRGFSSLGVTQIEDTRHLMMIDRPEAIIRAVEKCSV